MALRLAHEGYYGGDPDKVLSARVDHVLAAIEYEKFRSDYQEIEYELNKNS